MYSRSVLLFAWIFLGTLSTFLVTCKSLFSGINVFLSNVTCTFQGSLTPQRPSWRALMSLMYVCTQLLSVFLVWSTYQLMSIDSRSQNISSSLFISSSAVVTFSTTTLQEFIGWARNYVGPCNAHPKIISVAFTLSKSRFVHPVTNTR